MSSREIWIKKHRRLTPTGKEITVKGHHRRISNVGFMKAMSGEPTDEIQIFIDECRAAGYTDKDCLDMRALAGPKVPFRSAERAFGGRFNPKLHKERQRKLAKTLKEDVEFQQMVHMYVGDPAREKVRRSHLEGMPRDKLEDLFEQYFEGETPPKDKDHLISDLLAAERGYGKFYD